MPTKLSVWCERIVEAGWLAALITAPLYFNVHSSRIFEPDKIALLRSITLIMALAWIVRGVEHWRGRFEKRKRTQRSFSENHQEPLSLWRRLTVNPLLLLTLFFFVDYIFASVVSIAPRLSVWGSYERLQGLYTTSAYIIIFFSIVALLRTQEQLERLLTTGIVVSLPVALYGILQHFGVDPMPWKIDVSHRVTSSLGNPIFVGAFLIMTTPLTLYRLVLAARTIADNISGKARPLLHASGLFTMLLQLGAWWVGPIAGSLAIAAVMMGWFFVAHFMRKPPLPFLRVAVYGVLFSTQLTCIFFTQSRGPWLGLLVGLFFFAVLWSLTYRFWRQAVLIMGSGCLLALLLTVLVLPDSPLRFVSDFPYVGRFSRVFERTGQVRMLVWQGAVDLIAADPVRAAIGYGPETMLVAYYPYYSPELVQVESRTAVPDRSHNETLDVVVTTGFVGLTLYVLFLTGLFHQGLKKIGIIRSAVGCRVFLGLWVVGGVGVTLLVRVLDHSWRFCGVALPLGMLGGLFAYLGWYGFTNRRVGERQEENSVNKGLPFVAIPLLSALIAHFIEISFGIAIVSSRTYFWVYAALLVVTGRTWVSSALVEDTSPERRRRRQEEERGGPRSGASRKKPQARPIRSPSPWSCSLIANSLVVGFVLITMVYAFFSPQIEKTHFLSIVWLFAFTCLIAGMVVLTETDSANGATFSLTTELKWYGVSTGIAAVSAFIFAAVHQSMLLFGNDPAFIPMPYYVFTGVAMLVLGGVLLLGEQMPKRAMAGIRGLFYPLLVVGVIGVIIETNLDIVRADIYYRQAWLAYHTKKQYDPAIVLGRRATALTPTQDFYFLFLADALIEKAKQSADPTERERFFQEAEHALIHARNINPLKLDHTAGLARLHQIWAQRTKAPAERTAHLQRSAMLYQQATELSPRSPYAWNEWGATHFLLGETKKAIEKYQHSLALDPTFAQTYLALGTLYSKQRQWPEAARAYEEAVARRPASIKGHKALGSVYTMQKRLAEAAQQFQRVLELAPDDLVSHRTLAQIYRVTGQPEQALKHAQRALAYAPPKERPFLERLITQLQPRRKDPGP